MGAGRVSSQAGQEPPAGSRCPPAQQGPWGCCLTSTPAAAHPLKGHLHAALLLAEVRQERLLLVGLWGGAGTRSSAVVAVGARTGAKKASTSGTGPQTLPIVRVINQAIFSVLMEGYSPACPASPYLHEPGREVHGHGGAVHRLHDVRQLIGGGAAVVLHHLLRAQQLPERGDPHGGAGEALAAPGGRAAGAVGPSGGREAERETGGLAAQAGRAPRWPQAGLGMRLRRYGPLAGRPRARRRLAVQQLLGEAQAGAVHGPG